MCAVYPAPTSKSWMNNAFTYYPTVPLTPEVWGVVALHMCRKMGLGLSKRRSSQSSAGMRPDSLRRLRAHARGSRVGTATRIHRVDLLVPVAN